MRTPAVKSRTLQFAQRLDVQPAVATRARTAATARAQAKAPTSSHTPTTVDAGMRFTMVGVLCDPPRTRGEVVLRLRTSVDGQTWGRWYTAPLERSAEERGRPRAFTEALWTEEGRFVQVSAQAVADAAPVELVNVRLVALDTEGGETAGEKAAAALRGAAAAIADLDLTEPAAAAAVAPQLVTRDAWGADESLRKGEPTVAPLKMAFIHHTASGNTYSQADAPAIVRGIYVYHTTSLGWNDIGYNYLIDRFGTIYVGRYGGPEQDVVGAQVYGFNTGSMGVSVMGTYTGEAISEAAMGALQGLLAWKLELNGLDPLGTATMTCGATEKYTEGQTVTFPVISGHRDANYTSCPGDAFYGELKALSEKTATLVDLPAYQVTLNLSAAQVAVAGTVTFSGAVKTAAGAPGAGAVTLQKRPATGGSWTNWTTATLAADGSYRIAVKMSTAQDSELRAKMPGDAANLVGYSATQSLRVVATRAMLPVYRVTLNLSAARISAYGTITFSGAVKTAAGAPGAGAVTLQKRPATGGSWTDWRTATLAADGTYKRAIRMTSPQVSQVRAKMPGNAGNRTGFSAAQNLTVTLPKYQVTLSLSAAQINAYGAVTFSGAVKTAAGAPGAGAVTLQKRPATGGSWTDWTTATLAADGTYKRAIRMTSPQVSQVRAKMPGNAANLAGYSVTRTITVVALPVPITATEQTAFTITGRGWGHGIGMSQWGAYGLAKQGLLYKPILEHYYSGIGFTTVADATVRVLLRSGLQAVDLTCANDFTVKGSANAVTIPAGTTATTTYVDGKYRVVAGGFSRDFTAAVTFAATQGQLNLLTATDMKQTGLHRGTIRVVSSGSSLMMINYVALESYLRGVVPHEVPPSWPVETLKAQACAARAYAERARLSAGGRQWDLYCDSRSQVYTGMSREDYRSDAAIKATAGVVPTYGGVPIQAFYFSCSGGRTENIELAWETSPLPYLKGVADPYDSDAPLHTWGPYYRTSAQFTVALGTAVKGSLTAIYPVERGSSPRIVKAAIIGSSGTTYMHGSTLRVKLGLNSAWATFTSMSISPAAADTATIAAGGSVTLSGRIYPALASGTAVRLYSNYDGTWRTVNVATVPHSQSLVDGYTATYSSYSITLKPAYTTQYYFLSGSAKSPTTTITVR